MSMENKICPIISSGRDCFTPCQEEKCSLWIIKWDSVLGKNVCFCGLINKGA